VSSLISGRQRDFQTGSPSAQSRGSEASRGGRTWWAHLAFSRINIELTILQKEIEESLRNEPKTSRVGKCVGYLDLRAFQSEGQTGGGSSLISGHRFSGILIVAE